MPNHIQNKLKFIGNPESIVKIKDSIKSINEDKSENQIDFNKITQMPPDLDITSDGWLTPLENEFSAGTTLIDHIQELKAFCERNPDRKEKALSNFLKGITNYINYGHATWYSWNIENWGTKWNAYGQNDNRNTFDTIYFETAWASPIYLIEKLSRLFPDLTIELTYSDEDSGCNTGIFLFEKGKAISINQPENSSIEGFEIFLALHPDRADDFELVEGNYQYKES